MMLRWSALNCFLKLFFMLAFTDFISHTCAINADTASATEIQSIGKLRSGAELAFSKGETDQALQLWEKVIAMEPNNDSNYYKRYRVYIRQLKLKEALSDLNVALSLNPQNENALVQRGKLHLRMGRCEESVVDFELLQK
jgi:tetratricopeptide (TPR) repeat protein